MDKWIYSFEEGRAEDKALLGGKVPVRKCGSF